MKKRKLLYRVVIIITLIIFVVISASLIYYHLYKNYDEQVSERISNDVIVINDIFSSMYLVKSDSGYIAIDTGFFTGIIEKALELNQIKPEEIRAILITHSDWDHQNAVELFSSAKVYFPAEEKQMVKNKVQRFSFIPYLSNSYNIIKNKNCKDGEEFIISGRKIKCISLPGHTLGSMGYIIDDKYLFSGDAFRIKNGKIDVPYKKLFVMDLEQMKESLKKVSHLKGIEYIFSAHSGFTADFNYAISNIKFDN